MSGTTPNLGMTLPTVGASADTWGGTLNADLNILDAASITYLPLAGGTMTGAIVLPSNAASALQAVPLQQLTAGYLPLAGGTLTGALTLAADPAANLQPVSLQYLNARAGTATPTMAGTAAVGTSLLYSRQDHVHPSDTSRITQAQGDARYLQLVGGTLSGNLTLPFMHSTGTIQIDSASGINYANTGEYILPSTGSGYIGMTSNIRGFLYATATTSDVRLKSNIGDSGDALAELMTFDVRSFDLHWPGDPLPRHHDFGLVADELPDDCVIAPPGAYKSLDMRGLVARCIKAIQQLATRDAPAR